MRALAFLLIHAPRTVSLAQLDAALRRELALRAACAIAGQPSPHQLPPGSPIAISLALAAALAVALATR